MYLERVIWLGLSLAAAACNRHGFLLGIEPSIETVSPLSGPAAGGTTLTISGRGFVMDAQFRVGGEPCVPLERASNYSIRCVTSPMTPGPAQVEVHSAQGYAVAETLFNAVGAPTVTEVTPSQGVPGTQLTLRGQFFRPGITARVGNSACGNLMMLDPETLVCTAPALPSGVVDVTVSNDDGQTSTLRDAFEYVDLTPELSAVVPDVGPLEGGEVTLMGADFVPGATVTIGGQACADLVVESPTQARCQAPGVSAPAQVDVIFQNPDGEQATLVDGYRYAVFSLLTLVSPSHGPAAGGTLLTLEGSNFQAGLVVHMRPSGCNQSSCRTVCLVDSVHGSGTSATCTTATTPPGPCDVIVINPDTYSATLPLAFTFDPRPTVTGVSPPSGPLDGHQVTIQGTGFVSTPSVPQVFFGGLPCASVNVVSSTELTCTTPANPPGAVDVQVVNPDGQDDTLTNAYTYVVGPTLTAVTPNEGPLAGRTVTISGSDFRSTPSLPVVTFDGSPCASLAFVSSTELTCTAPAHVAGAVDVVVQNADGQEDTLNDAFTYRAPPSIDAVSPPHILQQTTPSITISGSDFRAGSTVTVGGSPCTAPVISATSITCQAPSFSVTFVSISQEIVVTDPDGQSDTLSPGLIYYDHGVLDHTWGSGALARYHQGASSDHAEVFSAMVARVDGTVLVAGEVDPVGADNRDVFVARYRDDGTLDPSFGGGDGIEFYTGPNSDRDDFVEDIIELPSGDIVLVGTSGYGNGCVWKFDGNGQNPVLFSVDHGATERLYGVAVDDSQRIVVAGLSGDPTGRTEILVARLNATASAYDTTLGGAGHMTWSYFPDPDVLQTALDVEAQGSNVYLVGRAWDTTFLTVGAYRAFVMALQASNGALDASFNDGGSWIDTLTIVPPGRTESMFTSVALTPTRLIVTGPEGDNSGSYGSAVAVFRRSDGALDPTFGSGGRTVTHYSIAGISNNDVPTHVEVLADDRIVHLGKVVLTASPQDENLFVRRLNADGTVDTSFYQNGYMSVTTGLGERCLGGAVQSNGKVICSGFTSNTCIPTDFGRPCDNVSDAIMVRWWL